MNLKNSKPNIQFICIIILLISSLTLHAQDFKKKLKIYGFVKLNNISDKDSFANVILFKNGEVLKSIKAKNDNQFKFYLDYQFEYLITVEKTGYISKSIIIKTYIDKFKIVDDDSLPFRITLCPQPKDSILEYKNPIGLYRYFENLDSFEFDLEYHRISNKNLKFLNCE